MGVPVGVDAAEFVGLAGGCRLSGGVAIGVITYRRPLGLRRLLSSLEGLRFAKISGVDLRVIVVDNDPDGSARSVVEAAIPGFPWPLSYDRETARGVVHARNRAIALADGCDLVAFVDDDEIVEPSWLDELLAAQRLYDADLVVGPVLPLFEDPPPGWIVDGGVFEPSRRLPTGSAPVYVGAGNMLLRRRVLGQLAGPFDPRFSLTGGEDTFLHLQLMTLGGRLVWCEEAVAREFVPPARMNFRWIIQRAYRNGNVAALCERALQGHRLVAFPAAAKGAARLLVGIAGLCPAILMGRGAATRQVTMIARGAGRVVGALGHGFGGYAGESVP